MMSFIVFLILLGIIPLIIIRKNSKKNALNAPTDRNVQNTRNQTSTQTQAPVVRTNANIARVPVQECDNDIIQQPKDNTLEKILIILFLLSLIAVGVFWGYNTISSEFKNNGSSPNSGEKIENNIPRTETLYFKDYPNGIIEYTSFRNFNNYPLGGCITVTNPSGKIWKDCPGVTIKNETSGGTFLYEKSSQSKALGVTIVVH